MLSVNKKIGFQSVAFSPAYYKQAIKNYQQGNFRDLIALMEKAEIDSHIAGCLMGRRAGFLKEWRLTEASDASADLAVKDFIEGVLMRINMRELFEDVQEARLKKYSVIDLSWEVVEGRQVITQAKKVPQKYFRYDEDGILRLDFGGKDLREIPEDGALICESNRDPILLPVLRDFILKEFGLESWASFLETFGEAFIIGRYPAGADENFKTELENGVNTLASSSRGIMPEGSNIEIIETKRNTGDHQSFDERCDRGISISILGHANAVSRSSGMQVGENQEAYKVKREIALGDIYYIEEQISRLVRLLWRRNFASGQPPLFSLDKSEPINVNERLAVLQFAYDAGYIIHPDELAKLGLYKFPEQTPLQKQTINLLD